MLTICDLFHNEATMNLTELSNDESQLSFYYNEDRVGTYRSISLVLLKAKLRLFGAYKSTKVYLPCNLTYLTLDFIPGYWVSLDCFYNCLWDL